MEKWEKNFDEQLLEQRFAGGHIVKDFATFASDTEAQTSHGP